MKTKNYRKTCITMLGSVLLLIKTKLAYCVPIDLDIVSVDISGVEVLVATCLVGCAMMWGIRKLIKILNRS